MNIEQVIKKFDDNSLITKNDIASLLMIDDQDKLKKLFDAAYRVKISNLGKNVYLRGIIEFSNICRKDCYYCGIRRSNKSVERYSLKEDEIIKNAKWAHEQKYGSIVLQSGERNDKSFVDFIESILRKIKEVSNGELGITISLGEQTKEVYKRWFEAGAHRYLLRIETTNPTLYSKLHPPDHSFSERVNCLMDLKEVGFQVGTGVMIGLPNQTIEDLADDVLFFKEFDIDMIGMGPYLVSRNTPTAELVEDSEEEKQKNYTLALKMIAVTRLLLKDVNIASTTALQALKPFGREMGLMAGANIIMPNITDVEYRENYQLYDNKPCIDESSEECIGCLDKRVYQISESIGYGSWGDSPHFTKRNINRN